MRKKSRAEKEGETLGRAILGTRELFYQNNTKANYLKGLIGVLQQELDEQRG